jgi:hypothetical protein
LAQKDDTALIGGPLHRWGLDHEFRELAMETGPPCPFGPRLDPKGQYNSFWRILYKRREIILNIIWGKSTFLIVCHIV